MSRVERKSNFPHRISKLRSWWWFWWRAQKNTSNIKSMKLSFKVNHQMSWIKERKEFESGNRINVIFVSICNKNAFISSLIQLTVSHSPMCLFVCHQLTSYSSVFNAWHFTWAHFERIPEDVSLITQIQLKFLSECVVPVPTNI